jgi:CBS domain-containing protein
MRTDLKGVVTLAKLGPKLSGGALGRLVARWTEDRLGSAASRVGSLPARPRVRPAPGEAARAAPTAEIKPAKSQAQPHPWDSPTGAHPEPVPLVSPSDVVNPLLKVSNVMTANPRTCSPASAALEAVLVFRDAHCGVIPGTQEERPVGVVTNRDIALALADHEADLARTPLEALTTREVATIAADAPLDAAVAALGERGLRRLVVVDTEGRLAGILSWTDLAPDLSERGLGQLVARIIDHR